jgi:hypothetical protein
MTKQHQRHAAGTLGANRTASAKSRNEQGKLHGWTPSTTQYVYEKESGISYAAVIRRIAFLALFSIVMVFTVNAMMVQWIN